MPPASFACRSTSRTTLRDMVPRCSGLPQTKQWSHSMVHWYVRRRWSPEGFTPAGREEHAKDAPYIQCPLPLGFGGDAPGDRPQPKSPRLFWPAVAPPCAGNSYSMRPARRRNSFTLPGPNPAYWFSVHTIATFRSRRSPYTSSRNQDLCRNSIACGYFRSKPRTNSCRRVQWVSYLIEGGSWATSEPHFSLS